MPVKFYFYYLKLFLYVLIYDACFDFSVIWEVLKTLL